MILALAAFALVAVVVPALLLAADVPPDPLIQLLTDALSMGSTMGYVIAGVVALLILVPIALKAFGKSVPFLDPILKVLAAVLSRVVKGKTVEAPPVRDGEAPEPKGVADVVQIKDWPEDKK